VFPTAFIVAALIGGCLGGCGHIFRKRPRKVASRIKYVLEGCTVGIIVVAAAAAGIVIFSLPTAVLGTELGAFVLGSFAGYAGTPVLDKLVTKNTEGSGKT
jgi:hypothetical protein